MKDVKIDDELWLIAPSVLSVVAGDTRPRKPWLGRVFWMVDRDTFRVGAVGKDGSIGVEDDVIAYVKAGEMYVTREEARDAYVAALEELVERKGYELDCARKELLRWLDASIHNQIEPAHT